jgi:hypothetical protein
MNPRLTKRSLLVAATLSLCLASSISAQVPTGEVGGQVTDESGAALPGVTVTATSPNLQGERTVHTTQNGAYQIPLLPPGLYEIAYQLEGMTAVTREVKVSAGQGQRVDVRMGLDIVTEQITVTADAQVISTTSTAQATFTSEEISELPVNRGVLDTVALAAGTSETGPGGNTTISGAMSFENLWLVNGVVVNENLRGQPLNLFIEDAIQETTTSTGAVGAQHGRFTGGVVNVLTKSGGNEFTGSLRASLSNQDWVSTGREELFNPDFQAEDQVNDTYEATLGGFLLRDRIWFFAAGRDLELEEIAQTSQTGISFPQVSEQQRYEGKLTFQITDSHSLIGSYLEIDQLAGNSFFTALDPLDLAVLTDRTDPQELKSINYRGIFTPEFYVEAQYSERDFNIGVGGGGPRDLAAGSPWETIFDNSYWHAPFFCGECEDELRNNENFLINGSYFLSTATAGTHDLVFGYDTFTDVRFSINHQSGSDFRLAAEDFFFDDAGNVYPVASGTGQAWVSVWPVFGLDQARATDFETNSFYVNDRWELNDKWGFNIGLRYDENDGRDAGGNLTTDDSKLSPRLAATFDTKGDGDLILHASASRYVAAIASNIADSTSTGGALGRALLFYRGEPINPNGAACLATNTCVDSRTAAQMFIDWWLAETGFNPITDPAENIASIAAEFGLVFPSSETNVIVPDTIRSPSADELALGLTKRLGNRGMFRGDLVYRDWTDFYSNRVRPNNQVPIAGRPQDLVEVGNFGNDELSREYLGLQTQFRYRVNDRLRTGATYTLSELEGNINGETTGSGPVTSSPNQRPEYFDAAWSFPVGHLSAHQRHKLRAWGIYDVIDSDRQSLSVSVLQSFFSGQPYGAVGAVDTRPFVENPGYITRPASVTYFFTDRDAFETDDTSSTDLALNYSFRLNAFGRRLEVFLQPQILNLFDEDSAGGVNIGVQDATTGGSCPDSATGRCLPFDPFTQTPVEGVHWVKGDTFGEPTSGGDFQTPRTFRFSIGFRF